MNLYIRFVYGANQIHKAFLIILLCASLCWESSLEFSNCVTGVVHTAKVHQYTRVVLASRHYLVYANNAKERRLTKMFLGANDACEAPCTRSAQVFLLLREDRGVGFLLFLILFPRNFHFVFIKFATFQWVPQLVPNSSHFICHILCPQYYSCNLYQGAQRMRLRLQHIISVSANLDLKKLCRAKQRCWSVLFFLGRNIAKFQPEKYDFNLYKGFSTKKWPKFARFPID